MKKIIILFIFIYHFNYVFGQWNDNTFTEKKYDVIYENIQNIEIEVYQNVTVRFNQNINVDYKYNNSPEGVLGAFRNLPSTSLNNLFYYNKDEENIRKKEEQSRTKVNNEITYSRDSENFYELMFKLNFDYFDTPTTAIKVTAFDEEGDKISPIRHEIYCFQQINTQWYMIDFERFHEKNSWFIKALLHSKPEALQTLIKGKNPKNHPLLRQMIDKTTENGVFDFNLYIEEMALAIKSKDEKLYNYFFKPN